MNAPARITAWKPHPGPQTALLRCPVFEAMFGGARGGGKTSGMGGVWAVRAGRYGNQARGLMLRRERTQLQATISEFEQVYSKIGAKWKDSDKKFVMPGGAELFMGYLERDQDADVYQGWNLTDLFVEEIGNFPRFAPIAKLFATLRSASGVPVRFRCTANPGGPGHSWCKTRYVDPAPRGMTVLPEVIRNPLDGSEIIRERVYIPSRVTDNPTLGSDYIGNLVMSGAGSPSLVRAWLEGDWSAIEGAFFPEWSTARHIIAPFEIPEHWTRWAAVDWGTARPFCVLWMAIASEDTRVHNRIIPRGCVVVYREWYGARRDLSGQIVPNEGLKLPANEVATRCKAMTQEALEFAVIDPATFSNTGGQTIAEAFVTHWMDFLRADNTRVGKAGAMSGWNNVRTRLVGEDENRPMLVVFDTCTNLIRTLPVIQHDRNRAEDLDSDSEDHAVDCLRYGLAARPWMGKRSAQAEPMKDITQATAHDLFFGRMAR